MKTRLLLLVLLLGIVSFLSLQAYPFWEGFGVIMACLTALWIVSLILKDASIIDIFWGVGFVIVAWFYRERLHLTDTRSLVLCLLVSVWGLRLGIHLAIRNLGHGEDYRYQVWRKQHGKNWWWVSYLRVFLLQGMILWIVSAVLLVGMTPTHTAMQWLDWAGIVLWGVGFGFEAVGDWQLTQFKKNPANKGQLLQTGLWALTRHPNYFGDALLWWGYFCFACTNSAFAYVFSPLLMTFLLMKVSGVALLEQKLAATKPQFEAYRKQVPAFFPKLF